MAVARTTFLERFEEFESTPWPTIDAALAYAERRTPLDVWCELQEDGIVYLAAHTLAMSPSSRDMRLVAEDGSTLYHDERKRLEQIVANAPRVAGVPVFLKT